MKRIDELGISPNPWKGVRWGGSDERMFYSVYDSSGGVVCDCLRGSNHIKSDARLIAAAPELYECLREAIVDSCNRCCNHEDGECRLDGDTCIVQRWRAALEDAEGGE